MNPVPPSPERLKKRLSNKALHYLGRYASTTRRLRQVLERFGARKLEHADPDHLQQAIEDTIQTCQRLGYVDDASFIQTRIRNGRKAGLSARQIITKLVYAGIDRQAAYDGLSQYEGNKTGTRDELIAGLVHARKRKLGPFYAELDRTHKTDHQHMGRLARAGFSLSVVRQIMALSTIQEAEILMQEIQQNESKTN